MVISVFQGSAMVEDGVEARVKRALRKMILQEEQVTAYFFVDTPFSLLCEWIVRELRAELPGKEIESRVILWGDQERVFPPVRFSSVERHGPEEGNDRDAYIWMANHCDYVYCYIHPMLYTSRQSLTAYQYAEKRLGSRCINFATPEAWEQVRLAVPSLVRWERLAFEGRMQGEKKAVLARELSVHPSTVWKYEVSACYHLTEKVYTKQLCSRRCAVLDFSSRSLPAWKMKSLLETLRYLVRCLYVTEFIVPEMVYTGDTELMWILQQIKREAATPIRVNAMKQQCSRNEAWQYGDSKYLYRCEPTPSGYASRLYEERKAMIDLADLVLCCPRSNYRSALAYAAKKHRPVINLAPYGLEYVDGQAYD